MAMIQAATARKSLYSVHPGVEMVQDWIVKLPEKTGRTLEDWIRLVEKSGPPTEKERREWLKKEFKLGTNSAWWIAERAAGKAGRRRRPAGVSRSRRPVRRRNVCRAQGGAASDL